MAFNMIKIDEGADKNIATHLVSEGGEDKHLERVAQSSGVQTVPPAQIVGIDSAGDYPASAISVTTALAIVIQSWWSALDSNGAIIQLLFYDSAGTLLSVTDEMTITCPNDRDEISGKYLGSCLTVDNSKLGADSMKIRVVDPSVSALLDFKVSYV